MSHSPRPRTRRLRAHCLPALLAVLLAAPPADGETVAGPGPAVTAEAGAAPVDGQQSVVADPALPAASPRRPWLALGEATASNVAIWAVNWYVRRQEWARIDVGVWKANLSTGFRFDDDYFATNQLAHPYHGGLYFNAARANGYDYWSSAPFVLFGTLQWELFFENQAPSTNDLLNTGLGGLTMGEALFRLSSMVLDNRARGLDRLRRELLGALVDPLRGVNRLVTGEAWRLAPTPAEWSPAIFANQVEAGGLQVPGGAKRLQFFFEASLWFGDPLRTSLREPFDAFWLSAQFTSKEGRAISHAGIDGVLGARSLRSSADDRLVLAALQSLEYVDTQSYELGSQALAAGLLYRRAFADGMELRASVLARGLALAGISSDHAGVVGRSYDYGPGAGLQLRASYGSWPREMVALEAGTAWIHTLNGAEGDHLAQDLELRVEVPLHDELGVGLAVQLFRRHTFYRHFGRVTSTVPGLRLFLALR